MYTTSTLITGSLCLVTYICTTVLKGEFMAYTEMCFNCKAIPTNDTDYSCHIKAVELV